METLTLLPAAHCLPSRHGWARRGGGVRPPAWHAPAVPAGNSGSAGWEHEKIFRNPILFLDTVKFVPYMNLINTRSAPAPCPSPSSEGEVAPRQRGRWGCLSARPHRRAARSVDGNISSPNCFCDRPEARFPAIPRGSGGPGAKKTLKDGPVCLIRHRARKNDGKLRKTTASAEKNTGTSDQKRRAADRPPVRRFAGRFRVSAPSRGSRP